MITVTIHIEDRKIPKSTEDFKAVADSIRAAAERIEQGYDAGEDFEFSWNIEGDVN